jgi:hypothetical protein
VAEVGVDLPDQQVGEVDDGASDSSERRDRRGRLEGDPREDQCDEAGAQEAGHDVERLRRVPKTR